MVYEILKIPEDTADLFRSFRAAPDFTIRRRLIRDAPLPKGCTFSLKVNRSETLDRDRINLPLEVARAMGKVWGVVISIRGGTDSANTDSPASGQILPKIPFWGNDRLAYRSVFVRSAAYFANFTPRQPDNLSWNITRGDVISGLLQRLYHTLSLLRHS